MYAIVNGDNIKLIRELPKQYTFSDGRQTSRFDKMDSSIQIAEGYLPVVDVKPSYDSRIERLELDTTVAGATEVTRTYVKVAIDIEVLKTQKVAQIAKHEESLLSSSLFEYDSKIFRMSNEAVDNATQLQTRIAISGFPDPFSWTDAYGVEVPMTQAEFTAFGADIANQKLNIIGISKYHVGNVNALTDELTVYNYDYSAGWDNYVEPVVDDIL